MNIRPYDYLRDFKYLKLAVKEQHKGYVESIREGFFTPDKRELVARCLGTALSRILSNVRGFNTGNGNAGFYSYLSYTNNPEARKADDEPFLQQESDIIAASRYYGANLICGCVRSYRKAAKSYKELTGRKEQLRFSYMEQALTILDTICEQSGVSLQGALNRFAEKPFANFYMAPGLEMNYERARNLFFRQIRDFMREMNWYNFLPVQDYGYKLQDMAHECIALLYIMCYPSDRAAFLVTCGNIYWNWGIKLRGSCADTEIPDLFKV